MRKESTQEFAVIFDMDGVIIDSNPVHRRALVQFFDRHNIILTEQELREKVFGRTNEEWLREAFPGITEEKINRYIEEKEALYRELYADTIEPLPGLRNFLDSLRSHNIPLAIATSAPKVNADWVLDKTQLAGYFQTILTAKNVELGKPHPEIYLKTASALDVAPASCIVFEDSLSGMEAAGRAGAVVVGVSTTHSPEEMQGTAMIIEDFTGLDYEKVVSLPNPKRNPALIDS